MKNYNVYLDRMSKSLEEKLFFESKLDLHNKIIIDFGCANAELISHLAPIYQNSSFFGIEKDYNLFNFATEKCKNFKNVIIDQNLETIKTILETVEFEKEVIMVCSSVLHELDNYEQSILFRFVDDYCDYLVIRDMYFIGQFSDKFLHYRDKIKEKADWTLEAFERVYGSINNVQNLYHYLLKYTYKENWETEIKENYFSVNWRLINWYNTYSNWSIEYLNDYILEFKKEQVKQDFDIDLEELGLPTHRQLIMKIERNV